MFEGISDVPDQYNFRSALMILILVHIYLVKCVSISLVEKKIIVGIVFRMSKFPS